MLRDLTTCFICQFFYYLSEENPQEPTNHKTTVYVNEGFPQPFLLCNHVLRLLSQTGVKHSDTIIYVQIAIRMFDNIDFVSVTERMEEYIMSLAVILNVPLTNVLYIKTSKAAGDFSRHAQQIRCNLILPSYVTERMPHYSSNE
jgi:hypothetical protein